MTTLSDSEFPDLVLSTEDESSHVAQTTLEAGGKGIDMQDSIEPNHETVVPISDSSTVYDSLSLDQLQEFIDASYQKTLAYELSLAPSIDSSTPFKPQPVKSSTLNPVQEQFNIFKENIESKVTALMTKIAEQTKIIENNNHEELCKLSNENLHLKSRLSDLEKTFYAKKIRPLQSNDPKSWWSTIKKICNSSKNQQIFLTNSENGEPLTSSESAEEINNYLVNLTKNYVKISDDQSLTLPLVSRASVTTVGKNSIN